MIKQRQGLRRSDILIVAATAREARYVPGGLEVLVTGIGKVQAASAVARALATRPRQLVVNIGACGALAPGRSGLFVPSVVINHDMSTAAIRHLGYDVTDELRLDGGDGSVLATGDQLVTDATVRDRLAERAWLVDMEGFAVAWAARDGDTDVQLVKHVTDEADDPDLDWATVAERSAQALGIWLHDHLPV